MPSIEDRTRGMNNAKREAYLTLKGWRWTGAGWIAPNSVESTDGDVFTLKQGSGGMFSTTTAVYEQLAREDPEHYSEPDEWGRYYREPHTL